MSLLGPEGVQSRMAQIQSRLDALAPRPIQNPAFAQTYNRAVGTPAPLAGNLPTGTPGILDPSTASPVCGTIGKGGSEGFQAMADAAADKYGVDRNLFRALVNQESGWDPSARSTVGAQGLCQLMPDTAKGLGVSDPYDPQQNLEGGARYLRQMLDANGGDPSLALASYNWGPGHVKNRPHIASWPHETQQYVTRIMGRVRGGAA